MSFGTAVITPRWLYVLAAATPTEFGDPSIWDETLNQIDPSQFAAGDIAGIGIHTGNALRGYAVGRQLRERGVTVVYGGIHATLYPEETFERGAAHAAVKGDGDVVWASVLQDFARGVPQRIYDGGRVDADQFKLARWDLMPEGAYMWASVQTVRGCPKHCSFCSVWRTDGQKPRQRGVDAVVQEIVELRRKGFRFIALADDNFYPVSETDIRLAERQKNFGRVEQLKGIRRERFELMEQLAKLPKDTVFFTQITMEAAEDPTFLDAMRKANIKGALVGIEAVTPEGLKAVYKDFNCSGEKLVERLQEFTAHGVHVLGSFIFGLPTDREGTFDATCELAERAGVTFAQFVTLTPFAGTVDFEHWEKSFAGNPPLVEGIPLTRYWLIPAERRPKLFMPHPTMKSEEMRQRTQQVWDRFYNLANVWKRSGCVKSLKSRLAFVLISKLYRQMYASTGLATDSARRTEANKSAKLLAKACQKLFLGKPMPDLQMPSPVARGAAAAESEEMFRVVGQA
jgi:radical SAM superfamily enzyme YgiQ (UPF0313 family)